MSWQQSLVVGWFQYAVEGAIVLALASLAIGWIAQPWVAISLADGTVRVLGIQSGEKIARIGGQGERSDVAWLPTATNDSLLVIANQAAASVYRIKGTNAKQ